ncbi:conserved exported hypothetical protein [Candidatus Sulfopaludibacter sp. SbA3]|nr:conserved exported hypothetical protein [Candidatus Sulfopaludibacter sp. SbA3]
MLFRLIALFLAGASSVLAQSNPLPARETLYYNVEWRLITAGKAKVEWAGTPRSAGHVNMHLESVGLVSKLFRVEDDYAVNLSSGECAVSSQFTSHEGSRQRETRITYDGAAHKADYLERDRLKNIVLSQRQIEIPSCVHDVAGGMFFLRTLNLEPGQTTTVPVSDGKKSVSAKVEAQAREDIKTPEGLFHTIRYEVYLFNDVLYHRQAHLNLWISDDRRRLPVQIRVRMPITIGTITLQLEKHE